MSPLNGTTTAVNQELAKGYFKHYPDEAADILNDMDIDEILELVSRKPVDTIIPVIQRLNREVAVKVAERIEDGIFTKLFSVIDPMDGRALLSRFDEKIFKEKMSLLPAALSREYKELLSYPEDSAGALMDPKVAVFREDTAVRMVLETIRNMKNRRIVDICVVDDDDMLIKVISLQEIAFSSSETLLRGLMGRHISGIPALSPREDVVRTLEDKKLASLPVVDINGKLLGIIRHDALVSAAQQEVSEDLQAMFGAGKDERALSKISFAVKKRLPWLEINLATAFLAAAVVGAFEETIAKMTMLAVFLPVVAGQSGNTGSQALAVTMRGLALREIMTRHWLKIAFKEIAVGFLNGVAVAITTSVIAYIWMGSMGLSIVIAVAMVISMVIAGLSGALIPMILQSLGQDPAQSSSIVLTTVTDIVGFMSFLGLATILSKALGIY